MLAPSRRAVRLAVPNRRRARPPLLTTPALCSPAAARASGSRRPPSVGRGRHAHAPICLPRSLGVQGDHNHSATASILSVNQGLGWRVSMPPEAIRRRLIDMDEATGCEPRPHGSLATEFPHGSLWLGSHLARFGPTTPMRISERSPVRNDRSSIDLKDEAAMQAAAKSASHVRPDCGNAPRIRCRWKRYLPGRRPAACGGRRRGCTYIDQRRTLRAMMVSGRPAAALRIAHAGLASFAGRTGPMQIAGRDVGRRGRTGGGLAPPSTQVAALAPITRPQDRPPRTRARRRPRGDRRGRTPPTAVATATAASASPPSRRSAADRAG
jgi:hypothetical protein